MKKDRKKLHSDNSIPGLRSSAKSMFKYKTAFTLLELLVAMAVLAVLVVMLMGMVDSATKLWRVNENRVDSYRETRAALSIISRDLQSALAGANTNYFRLNDSTILPSGASLNTNAASIFFLSALPKSAQWSSTTNANKSDICQVGYFVGYGKTAASSNSSINTLNLYRYFLPSDDTFTRLATSNSPVFPNTLSLLHGNVELLARNIVSFQVKAYSTVNITNTNNNTVSTTLADYVPSTSAPMPDLVEIRIKAVNQEIAAKLTNASSWTATNTSPVKENLQAFSTRLRLINK